MKDDRLYLVHISECIARIADYTSSGRDAFFASTLIQDAVVRNLQVLAESTQRISEPLKATRPEIDWRGISGFRNVAVHSYLGIDVSRVWEIVERDLPQLRVAIDAMLQTTTPDATP